MLLSAVTAGDARRVPPDGYSTTGEPLRQPRACPFARTQELAATPTRLAKLDARTQERLINWGYAACDAAVRCHVDPSLPPPSGFPYPAAGV